MSAWRVSLVQPPLAWHDPAANRARFAQLPARAIEKQPFVAGVNRVGRDGLDVPYTGDSR